MDRQATINGVLLESGAILSSRQTQADQLASMHFRPHQSLVAEGITVTNSLGTVVDVQQIGLARDRLVQWGRLMRPADDRGARGTASPPAATGARPQAPPPPEGLAPAPDLSHRPHRRPPVERPMGSGNGIGLFDPQCFLILVWSNFQ